MIDHKKIIQERKIKFFHEILFSGKLTLNIHQVRESRLNESRCRLLLEDIARKQCFIQKNFILRFILSTYIFL